MRPLGQPSFARVLTRSRQPWFHGAGALASGKAVFKSIGPQWRSVSGPLALDPQRAAVMRGVSSTSLAFPVLIGMFRANESTGLLAGLNLPGVPPALTAARPTECQRLP